MAEWKSRVGRLALLLVVTIVSGCPLSTPSTPELRVSPGSTNFGSDQTVLDLAIENIGGGTLTWTAQEVVRASEDANWTATNISWLELGSDSGSIGTELDHLTLTASRTGLPSGRINNVGVQVTSNGGTVTIPVSLNVEAQLRVTPLSIALSAADTRTTFTVSNRGNVPLTWAASYLADPNDRDSGIPLPTGFAITPAGNVNQALTSISVEVTFPAGSSDFALLIDSSSGQEVVRFSVGSALTGLEITPTTLTLSIASNLEDGQMQPASTLSLKNVSDLPISWTLNLADRIDATRTPPITATPTLGKTEIGKTSEVAVRVSDATSIVQGDGLYELVVRIGDNFQVVPIIVDVLPLPTITIALPPETEFVQPPVVETNLLDFGEDLVQLPFYIVNTGSRDSELFFDIIYDQQGQDDALIASVSPNRGNTNGSDRDFFLFDENVYTDGAPIQVTLNRNNLVEDLETRNITVRAFENANFVARLTAVAEKTIQIRATKPPLTISGALNRSRAPSMLRFVFSNRNELGQIIPLQTPADQERIAYEIFENEILLDQDETRQYLNFEYRGNVVLILDFTGSMYHAGTTGPNPLAPGEAVGLMRQAALAFIDDLPPNFKLQLMYHSDRIPENRIIQRFTSDRNQLRSALERFNVAPALFGDSDIAETIEMAEASLLSEDPAGTLPLDDADVRAIVFITDGEETVQNNIVAGEEENRARLFPVAYSPNGDPVRLADLITAADESGGHLYTAGSVRNLSTVFGTRRDLEVVASTTDVPNAAAFIIRNLGTQAFDFTITPTDAPWLGAISLETGSVNAGANQQISVELLPGTIAPNTRLQATVNVRTNRNHSANVVVQFTTTADAVTNVYTAVRDETGTIWEELNNQAVLTYITPKEVDFQYLLSGAYLKADDTIIEGPFQRNAVFTRGDARVGQISLRSAGIIEDLTTTDPAQRYRAEIYVYADYTPRNIRSFDFRFLRQAAGDVSPAVQAMLNLADFRVELAEGGLLDDPNDTGTPDWRLIRDVDDRYRVVTDDEKPLPIGAFGNLLKITITNLSDYVNGFGNGARQPEFFLGMRMDNNPLLSPQSEGQPSSTKFFIYPGGIVNDQRVLSIALGEADLAGPAQFVEFLSEIVGFDPESPEALDSDMDGFPNYNDPSIFDDEVPGSRITPNPVDVTGDIDQFTLIIRNNLLDRFTWSVDTDNLPAWLPVDQIRYGASSESSSPIRPVLLPGETEAVRFSVLRTGLTPGTLLTDTITFTISNSDFGFITSESVSATLEINP